MQEEKKQSINHNAPDANTMRTPAEAADGLHPTYRLANAAHVSALERARFVGRNALSPAAPAHCKETNPIKMARLALWMLLAYVSMAHGVPWIYSTDEPMPSNTIRITTLGSGSPDVRKEQVRGRHARVAQMTQISTPGHNNNPHAPPCLRFVMHGNTGQLASGFLVEVGNGEQDKFIFDLGTGAYINLWATGVPMAKLTKVGGGGGEAGGLWGCCRRRVGGSGPMRCLSMQGAYPNPDSNRGCELPKGVPATVLQSVIWPTCSLLRMTTTRSQPTPYRPAGVPDPPPQRPPC